MVLKVCKPLFPPDEYQVWYRHTGQPEMEGTLRMVDYQTMSVDAIKADIGVRSITQLCIRGAIPQSLPTLAPLVLHLRLEGQINSTELEW